MTASPADNRSEFDLVRDALGADYELLEELGRGGMAIVYRARERELERDVAIKVLPSQFTFDEAFVERFQREGRIAAQLEHPHIVPIHRVGRSGRVIFFVMKLLRGQSLAGRLAERGRLPAREVRRILLETASALGYAAKRGVVHRDVKPDNILLDEDGRCVVTDFGIARSASDQKLTATGMSLGTPRYMSPEQARAKPLDGRSDLYSLGIVGYECLVGHTPFDSDDPVGLLMDHVKAPVPRPALDSSEEWEVFDVIERLLAKSPDDRFQSADELIATLEGGATRTARVVTHASRARLVSPTRPSAAIAGDGEPKRGRLQPAAALDRALRASLDLFRRQRPKLEAGRRALTHVTGRGRRFWIGVAAAATLVVSGYYGVHFATRHRSRCPVVEAGTALANVDARADANENESESRGFSIVLDALPATSAGSELDVYYDVCGLEEGASYTTRVTIEKNQSGIRRLLGGGVDPVTVSYDETARGPATRRHRTIDAPELPPGSYSVDVLVTDAHGRTRERAIDFQLTP